MKLQLTDRIVMNGLLPGKGTYSDLIVEKDIKKKVELTQEEIVKYNVKDLSDGRITWKPTEDTFEIAFTELEKDFVCKQLKQLDEKKELILAHMGVWDLFMKSKE